ncbi:hypothetical protein KQX72_14775 (plasmid) [Listeria monocytogenes]|uniref:hypothetical protein n=1 Tax=Listeria monocytogenes TaxID=1639 RepID=UPI00127F2CFB|nr:hypothetical protein [Listeria monocytogenes]ECJ9723939.1 hypothetical protein [Listeria monocytogenes]ECP9685330.1 hypothetical protein [Listeria monocytogenes]EKZ4627311.1 hypothetical protein [Listeria monocytogenes]QWU95807.1 hypothetical protein KQX72_14775 [Listeria monocytogenes]
MSELRIRGIDEQLRAFYHEKAKECNMSVGNYLKMLLEKNIFTQEIEKRENKFYQVIEDLQIIIQRQAEVMENFHHDIQLMISSNILDEGDLNEKGKDNSNT